MDTNRIQNLLAVEAGFVERDDRAWGGPREAWIEVASRCNLRCVMCPLTYDPRYHDGTVPEFLTPERFAALEPIFPTLDRAHLFGLGEPLLSPYLFDYARRLAAASVEVWTTTNATLIGPPQAEALADAGFRRVSVSIDGATRETYERIRVHGRYDDVIAGIRALGEVRRRRGFPELYLVMVGMASNLHELPALVDLAAELGADGVHLTSLYAWDHPAIEALVRAERLATLGPAAVAGHLAEARRRALAHGLQFSSHIDHGASSNGGGASRPQLQWPCSEPWSTVNVNARGEIRTCCFNDDVMGTLGEGANGDGFGEIWNGRPYREFRFNHLRLHAPPSCARCVKAGEVKQSPYLPQIGRRAHPPGPIESQATVARSNGDGGGNGSGAQQLRRLPIVLAPANGEPCDGRVVVIGTLPRPGLRQRLLRALEAAPMPGRWRTWAGRRAEPPVLPELYIDGELVARAADSGVTDGSRWAIVLEAAFVSAGSHRLSVRGPATGGEQWAERRLQFVGTGSVSEPVVGGTLAISIDLSRPEPEPRLTIGGHRRRPSTWICGTYGDAWRGFAVLDVADLPPGPHTVEISFVSEPAREMRFRRVAVAPPGAVPAR